MIGILDPALLMTRNSPTGDSDFQRDASWIINACKKWNVRLLPFQNYWNPLWLELGKDLEKTLSADGRRALQALRNLGKSNEQYTSQAGEVWRDGFKELFNAAVMGSDWEPRMAAAIVTACKLDENVILFVRRIQNRNLVTHISANHSTLDENTRWALYIQIPDGGTRQVLCYYSPRNFDERWSTRFDWRLPGKKTDNAKYPFCPPQMWWKRITPAWGTVESKHAWIDRYSNGWARPNIPNGSGEHWDVFLRHQPHRENIKADQINVAEFRIPKGKRDPGTIHHLGGNNINDIGWDC